MEISQKIILVRRVSRLTELIRQYNTLGQVKFMLESRGEDFLEYQQEHATYEEAIKEVSESLACMGRLQTIDRQFLPNFLFGRDDLVVVAGQDGLVANTLKYLDQQPVIGINPDPYRYDGKLLPFSVGDTDSIVKLVLRGNHRMESITMGEAKLNDGQSLLAVNDFFIGPERQTSALYELEYEGQRELQSSSGLIISTGMGATGWFSSVLSGIAGLAGTDIALRNLADSFDRSSRKLIFTVREPFQSQRTGTDIVKGIVTVGSTLKVQSKMPIGGVLFSDGMVDDAIPFNSGSQVEIGISQKSAQLVVG